MSVDQRWKSDAIEHINATVKTTVPKIKEIAEPAAGETPVVHADVEGDGKQIPEDDHISEDKTVRDFKITRQVLQKYGYSDHCVGCDEALHGKKRGHTSMCRKRLEEAMKADEVDQQRIRRRNERMTGKNHSTDQNNGDDVQMKDEKFDEEGKLVKKTSQKKLSPSHAWHLEPSSQMKVAFRNIVLMRTTKQQGRKVSMKTLCVHKSVKVKKPRSVKPPLKREEWH